VDTTVDLKGIDVGKKRIQEILAKTCDLIFVELSSFEQILLRFIEDLNPHHIFFRILDLASFQSEN
jgi:hypothetical protein